MQFRLELPDATELRGVLNAVLASLRSRHQIEIAIGPDDLEPLLAALSGLTAAQARQALSYVVLEDGRLAPDDIPRLIARKAQVVQDSGLLEYVPPGDNMFELGGFARLKAWLDRAQVGFSAEAKSLNLAPPRGLLVVGIQGCGKSLAAKAIGRAWGLPLLKLEAGRLFDKYVGETEKNFRRAIDLAAAMAPAVLWIDEIEKALAGGGGDDGGVSRRLLGAFLTWLQEHDEAVFVVATANDLTVLPPELLRKGRFDEVFFVDLPDDGERRSIFEIHLKLRKQNARGIRSRRPRVRHHRLQRRGDRASRDLSTVPGPASQVPARHDTAPRGDPGDGAALGLALRRCGPVADPGSRQVRARAVRSGAPGHPVNPWSTICCRVHATRLSGRGSAW